MRDFELRGTFYLGDFTSAGVLDKQADGVMQHLLDVEEATSGKVRDAAVSLDLAARTIEVELVVTAESLTEAHTHATAAVQGAFDNTGTVVEETNVEAAAV